MGAKPEGLVGREGEYYSEAAFLADNFNFHFPNFNFETHFT